MNFFSHQPSPGKTIRREVCFLILLTLVLQGSPCLGIQASKDADEISWHISAARATYDQEREIYVAEGDVVIQGGKTRLEADYAEFSTATQEAQASGHVLLISGEDTVTCNAISMNLATQTGTIHSGTVFIQENNFYIQGDTIQKTGKDTYTSDRASVTSCPGPSPDWKISARDISVTIEGYGFAKNATLWAKKIPMAYTPFLAFPVKTKRQTGLLSPALNISSRKGFEYEQPLYLALSRSTDATLTVDVMAKRGVKLGGEFRYVLNPESQGAMFYDFLDDQKLGDGKLANKDYSFEATPPRTNSDRYWFRMKHDQALPADWTFKLDLDIVSDADYLREFKGGASGFNAVNTYFESTFGRSLDEYDDITRTNRMNLNRTWSSYSVNLGASWYDNVLARTLDEADTTLQELPALQFFSSRQSLLDSGLQMDMVSGYTSFYRKDTTDTLINGQRADLHPRFYLPLTLGRFLSLEPSAGFRASAWKINPDSRKSGAEDEDDFFHREMVDLNLNLSTRVSRVYKPENGFADRIRHDIVPAVDYTYIPHVNQDDLPRFDELDFIQEKNAVTWSVTNRLTSRRAVPAPPSDSDKALSATENIYKEFVWLKVSQSYLLDRPDETDQESFSDITADLELSPCDYLTLEADAQWSPYRNRFTSHNAGFRISDRRGDAIYASHRFEQSASESLYTRVDAVLTPKINAFLVFEKDLLADKNVETTTGFNFRRSCWSLEMAYSDTPDDRAVTFVIHLFGIGEFGTR
ncbi:MAG: LPS assembly protein LptD [Pseudomonadota bacterium]